MGKKRSEPAASAVAAPTGFETAVIKFRRKPAKMGADYIFWIPRTYIRNGLVDPTVEYEVYLKRFATKPAPAPASAKPSPVAPEAEQQPFPGNE
jgi:hypothetical protein